MFYLSCDLDVIKIINFIITKRIEWEIKMAFLKGHKVFDEMKRKIGAKLKGQVSWINGI